MRKAAIYLPSAGHFSSTWPPPGRRREAWKWKSDRKVVYIFREKGYNRKKCVFRKEERRQNACARKMN